MSGSVAGLPVSNVVNTTLNISPNAAPISNFGVLAIMGSSGIIPLSQRFRTYTSLSAVTGDFGTATPEALAATIYFGQSPQPLTLMVGQWNQNATPGVLTGGYINPVSQTALITTLNGIANAGFSISFGGVAYNVVLGSLSGIVSLNQLAVLITSKLTALVAGTACLWSAQNNQFTITGVITGITGTISYASTPTGGQTDVSALLYLSQYVTVLPNVASGAYISNGAAAETPLAAATAMINGSLGWYELVFASQSLAISDHLAIANLIQASNPPRVYGVTDQSGLEITSTDTSSIGYLTSLAALSRTAVQYSSTSPYAIVSYFGRGNSVDFTAKNSVLTLNGKIEPTILPETLTITQVGYLASKNVNRYVMYQTGSAIIQDGTMANGYYFDEVQGSDWLANNVQTRLYNRIINTTTKVPQTDAGTTLLKNDCEAACADGVHNGLIAAGVWNGPNIGTIKTGDSLPSGYYVYAPPIASQAAYNRQLRTAPTLQICVCYAGAIQRANGIINVQR